MTRSRSTPKKRPPKYRPRPPKDFGTLGFLPISEVVKRSGLPKDTIWKEIHSGRLKAEKFSPRIWRVHESKLAEWVQNRLNGGDPGSSPADQQQGGESGKTIGQNSPASR